MALTSSSATDVVSVDLSDRARTLLPGAATTSREFSSAEAVTLYAEVYDNTRRVAAHNVDVKVALRDANGRTIRSVAQRRAAQELADGSNGFTLAVPLDGARAGDHVLHVEAGSDTDGRTVVSRDVPIRIR